MKYAIVCGSAEPTYCGVGKFSAKMTKILQKCGSEVAYLTSDKQRDYNENGGTLTVEPEQGNLLGGGLIDLFKFVRGHEPDIVNLQYQSFHKNYCDVLYPLVIKLAYSQAKVISTIHEFESFSWKGRLRQVLPMLMSDKVLFSDKRQRVTAVPYTLDLIKNRSEVVNVGPSVLVQLKTYRNKPTHNSEHLHIAFHGFVQPAKGLHLLLDALSKFSKPFTLHLLGSLDSLLTYSNDTEVEAYQAKLKRMIEENDQLRNNVKVYGDTDPKSKKFAEALEGIELAIFPFEDGVSNRRSSLFNTMMNSNAVIASTFDALYSDDGLESIVPLDYNSDSILNFLVEYSKWPLRQRHQVYQKQKQLKERYLSQEFEENIFNQLTLQS